MYAPCNSAALAGPWLPELMESRWGVGGRWAADLSACVTSDRGSRCGPAVRGGNGDAGWDALTAQVEDGRVGGGWAGVGVVLWVLPALASTDVVLAMLAERGYLGGAGLGKAA